MTNIIATNVSINCHNIKIRYKIDCYILQTVLLVIILLLIIAIISYHYAKHKSNQRGIDVLTVQKWKIMNFKKFVRVIISMTILKIYKLF